MLDVSHPNVRLLIFENSKACNQIKMFNFSDFYLVDRRVCFLLFWIREGEELCCFKNPFQGRSNSNILHFVGSESFKSAGNDPQSGLVVVVVVVVVVVSRWMQTSDITQCVITSEGQQRAARTVFAC